MTDKNIESPDQAGSPDQKLVNGGITDSGRRLGFWDSRYQLVLTLVVNFFLTAGIIFFLGEHYLDEYMQRTDSKLQKTTVGMDQSYENYKKELQQQIDQLKEDIAKPSFMAKSNYEHKLDKAVFDGAVITFNKEITKLREDLEILVKHVNKLYPKNGERLKISDRETTELLAQNRPASQGLGRYVPSFTLLVQEWLVIKKDVYFRDKKGLESGFSQGAWSKVQSFLSNLFDIQHIDAKNMTPTETFIRNVETYLFSKDIGTLIFYIEANMQNISSTAAKMPEWVEQLKSYQKAHDAVKDERKKADISGGGND